MRADVALCALSSFIWASRTCILSLICTGEGRMAQDWRRLNIYKL